MASPVGAKEESGGFLCSRKTLTRRWKCAIFTTAKQIRDSQFTFISVAEFSQKPRPMRLPRENVRAGCTIFCHRPVNGVHSIENTCTYKGVFLID